MVLARWAGLWGPVIYLFANHCWNKRSWGVCGVKGSGGSSAARTGPSCSLYALLRSCLTISWVFLHNFQTLDILDLTNNTGVILSELRGGCANTTKNNGSGDGSSTS
jgi:hypothetical protein